MNEKSEILNEYVASFCGDLKERYAINYGAGQYNLKRGLRNADGTGVLVGFRTALPCLFPESSTTAVTTLWI